MTVDALRDLWDAALDLYLGSACAGCGGPGRALCPACEAALPSGARLALPTPCPPGLVPVWAGGEYDGMLRELVLAHKEHRRIALARPLGTVLAHAVEAALPDPRSAGRLLLVPVPSSRGVVRRRGHDPLLRIAQRAASRLRRRGREVDVVRLLGVRRTPRDQSGLTASERWSNLQGAFAARRADGMRVALVDDVVTTGATLREAQRALEDAGAQVRAAVTICATTRRVVPSSGRSALVPPGNGY